MKFAARGLAVLFFGLVVSSAACSYYPRLELSDPPPVARLSAAPPPRAERVVIISVDGLRPDAIAAAGAVTMQKLIERGAYCAKAETIRPSITLPSHTAMLSGLDFQHHGIVWNNYRSGYIV